MILLAFYVSSTQSLCLADPNLHVLINFKLTDDTYKSVVIF
jgi:hypothetical protein